MITATEKDDALRNGILLIAHESIDLVPVIEKITGESQPRTADLSTEIPWRVETKYYAADLVVCCHQFSAEESLFADAAAVRADRWDAVVWAFDPAQMETTLKPLWTLVHRIMPTHEWEPNITVALSVGTAGDVEAGALCIKGKLPEIDRLDGDDDEADFGDGEDDDDNLDTWLARHGFELVESRTDVGWSRLIEALQAHMWDGFTPVTKGAAVDTDGSVAETEGKCPRIKSICDMLARIEDEDDNFDLESMLKEIKSLRTHAQTLPSEKRHDIAEQIALSIADRLLPDGGGDE